jgi:cell division protease FtsH
MNEEKNPRKQYAVYIVICLVLLMIFNAIVMPKLTQAAVRDTDYSFFLDSLDEGKVKKVQIEDSEITFTVEEDGKEQAYSTVRIDDPDLVTRLHESGDVEFTGRLRERSPLRDFLLGWIIPIVGMFMLWNLLFKGLGKRMGDLAMPCPSARAMRRFTSRRRQARPLPTWQDRTKPRKRLPR